MTGQIPLFNEFSQKMEEVKKMVSWDVLSQQQKWFVFLIREQNYSRRKIQEVWEATFQVPITFDALRTCALRTAFSLHWEQGALSYATNDYLIPEDMDSLKNEINERAQLHDAFDTVSVLDEAHRLKTRRTYLAIEFLHSIRSDGLATELEKKPLLPPTRSWINNILNLIESKLVHAQYIDGKRMLACSYERIDNFFNEFGEMIQLYSKIHLFNADETMLEITRPLKKVIPCTIPTYTEEEAPTFPHITAMCSVNIIGTKPPLFFILQKKKKLPKELSDLLISGQIWMISNPSGWMDRWSFFIWGLHFLGWVSGFRASLPQNQRNKDILLILDGHSSRENPITLELFKMYNIHLLVLPGHTTHVLQLFDVGLASPLKDKFTIIFSRHAKQKEQYTENSMTSNLRKIAIESFVEAWDSTANKPNCEAAARTVGLFPFNKDAPKNSGFVKNLSPAEQARQDAIDARKQRRLDINACEITTQEKIEEIRATVSRSKDDFLLAKKLSDFNNFFDLCCFYLSHAKKKGIYVHSMPPPLYGYAFDAIFSEVNRTANEEE